MGQSKHLLQHSTNQELKQTAYRDYTGQSNQHSFTTDKQY